MNQYSAPQAMACFQAFQGTDTGHDMLPAPSAALWCHVALLQDKVQQLEPLVGAVVAHGAAALPGAVAVAQDVADVAAAAARALELMGAGATGAGRQAPRECNGTPPFTVVGHDTVTATVENDWAGTPPLGGPSDGDVAGHAFGTCGNDIVDLDAAELLAKYTHYCEVCGKGFKRDANLRMHMRAHGDEYKTAAALSRPRNGGGIGKAGAARYSCPHDGCRWNRRHPRFRALKSMACAKNHYRRRHCAKMYVCARCGGKQFAVLSDLRTHEKHCGERRWHCSCGTAFSRKGKLMGHVALFVGHTPAPAEMRQA